MATFDFDSIKTRIQTALQGKTSWADILFFSTNARLIDSISEEEAYEMLYDEFLSRECKWSLAQNRSSLLALTAIHQYFAHRKVGATGSLRVSADSDFSAPPSKTVVIPKWSVFSDTGQGLKFVNVQAESITVADDYIDIDIVQGEPKSLTFTALGQTNEEFSITNSSIENENLYVTVNGTEWTLVNSLYDYPYDASDTSVGANQYFTVETKLDFSGVYIKFGDDIYGKKLTAGDTVIVNYLETSGAAGNIESANLITNVDSTIYDIDGDPVTVYCTNLGSVAGGVDDEDLESIRANAPKIFQTGDRASTQDDYNAILQTDFTYILHENVWGAYEYNIDNGNDPWAFVPSEENVVHVTALTTSGGNLSTAQKLEISETLNPLKSPTDILQFEDANIINLCFITDAYVSNRSYSLSTVKTAIVNTLNANYDLDNSDFFRHLYRSDYQALIDSVDGVSYHNTDLKFYKDEVFASAYLFQTVLEQYTILASSVQVYVRDNTALDPQFVLIAVDDGVGLFTAETGYDLTGSSIDYASGLTVINVVSGLSGTYTDYDIRLWYETTENNIILTGRANILAFDDANSTINVYYK